MIVKALDIWMLWQRLNLLYIVTTIAFTSVTSKQVWEIHCHLVLSLCDLDLSHCEFLVGLGDEGAYTWKVRRLPLSFMAKINIFYMVTLTFDPLMSQDDKVHVKLDFRWKLFYLCLKLILTFQGHGDLDLNNFHFMAKVNI